MECVILFRNTQNGLVGYVTDENDKIAVFKNEDEAVEASENTTICKAFPFQIVVLDEL